MALITDRFLNGRAARRLAKGSINMALLTEGGRQIGKGSMNMYLLTEGGLKPSIEVTPRIAASLRALIWVDAGFVEARAVSFAAQSSACF